MACETHKASTPPLFSIPQIGPPWQNFCIQPCLDWLRSICVKNYYSQIIYDLVIQRLWSLLMHMVIIVTPTTQKLCMFICTSIKAQDCMDDLTCKLDSSRERAIIISDQGCFKIQTVPSMGEQNSKILYTNYTTST